MCLILFNYKICQEFLLVLSSLLRYVYYFPLTSMPTLLNQWERLQVLLIMQEVNWIHLFLRIKLKKDNFLCQLQVQQNAFIVAVYTYYIIIYYVEVTGESAPKPASTVTPQKIETTSTIKTFKKILPLGAMLFFILFNYTILRDTKDVLVVTAPNSGT